ncbi:MAG: hypothetical protein KAJ13_05785 [Gemmatimonadetes bacterium]|nr:hypothetical protein [Gemmatimonadota bacterium]
MHRPKTVGLSLAAALGYDIWLTDGLALTLGANWLFQDVNVYTQSNNQLGMLTLGLTFF